MKTLILILLSGTAALAQNQVWFTIPNAYSINAPAGSTFRYGTYATTFLISTGTHQIGDPAPEAWSPLVTLPTAATFTVAGEFPVDPSYGTSKELDILETASPQIITNTPNDGGGSVPVTYTIPALPAPPVSPPLPQPVINIPVWVGPMLPCWSQKVTAKLPDGTDGKSYYAEICGPIS